VKKEPTQFEKTVLQSLFKLFGVREDASEELADESESYAIGWNFLEHAPFLQFLIEI